MRILVVSDIHGNLPALETVLSHAGQVDALWNLGDTVGYNPWPNECVELIRSYEQSIHLAGNHDLVAIGKASTRGANSAAAEAMRWTASHLLPANRDWLVQLPSIVVAGDVTLAHGSPRYPAWEYITSSTIASQNFAHFSTRICLVGHTHVPMVAVDGVSVAVERLFSPGDCQVFELSAGRSILNPGSVGQPRDRNPHAAYAIFDDDTLTMTFRRVEYPVEITQRAISKAGLPAQLAARLASGA